MPAVCSPSLYIHIPFCERKCFYCSFVVSVGQRHRVDDYLDALAREARQYIPLKCTHLYIGGGTPSFLDIRQLERLFQIIRQNLTVDPEAECAFEANPESLDAVNLEVLRRCGVNRISLGIQSFHAGYLKYLGRNHDAARAREAFALIRAAGFTNVNVDLMFSFPDQTMEQIMEDVEQVTGLGSEHISLYMLNLEENSRFHAQKLKLADDDLQAQQYMMVVGALEHAGYRQYEISNFARPGKESRHNLNYWQGGDYLGLGVGAHSYRDGKLSWNVARLNNYLERMREERSVVEGTQQLDSHGRFKQAVLIGLRMNRGVDLEGLQRSLNSCLKDEEREKIEHFIRHGFFVHEDGHLKATHKGRLVLDELCAQLS